MKQGHATMAKLTNVGSKRTELVELGIYFDTVFIIVSSVFNVVQQNIELENKNKDSINPPEIDKLATLVLIKKDNVVLRNTVNISRGVEDTLFLLSRHGNNETP